MPKSLRSFYPIMERSVPSRVSLARTKYQTVHRRHHRAQPSLNFISTCYSSVQASQTNLLTNAPTLNTFLVVHWPTDRVDQSTRIYNGIPWRTVLRGTSETPKPEIDYISSDTPDWFLMTPLATCPKVKTWSIEGWIWWCRTGWVIRTDFNEKKIKCNNEFVLICSS